MTLKADKKYVYLLFFAGFSLCLISFVIFPLVQRIKNNSQELIREKEQKNYFFLEKSNLQGSRAVYEKITPDLGKVDDIFLVGKTPIELELIKFLEKAASDFNISIKISSVGSENKKENQLSFMTVNLEASGSFNDFFKFLDRIENGNYLVEINNLIINRSTDNESVNGGVLSSVSLNVFKK